MTDTPFTIAIDTREQLPFDFPPGVQTERRALTTGDYAALVNGELLPVLIERKSHSDLYGSAFAGRDRFEREVQRALLAQAQLHIVTECSWADLDTPPVHARAANAFALKATLLSWSIKYNVRVWCPGSRDRAAALTFHLLRLAVRAIQPAAKE